MSQQGDKKEGIAMPALWDQLKLLHLSGIAEQLQQRNQEAIEHQVSYLEFLSLLLQDELLKKEQNKFIKTPVMMIHKLSALSNGTPMIW